MRVDDQGWGRTTWCAGEAGAIQSAGASLLVVGARGRSPFAGLMLGSVSQRCAAKAARPVVIVKLATDTVSDTQARVAE